jgi:hypothetical protein
MVTTNLRKRIEAVEHDVLPSMFIGVLAKDDEWIKDTLENKLPALEEKTLLMARECKKLGECAEGDKLCDEERIKKLFEDTRTMLEKEHLVRESKTRFHH